VTRGENPYNFYRFIRLLAAAAFIEVVAVSSQLFPQIPAEIIIDIVMGWRFTTVARLDTDPAC